MSDLSRHGMAERPITYRGVVKAVVRTPSNVRCRSASKYKPALGPP